MEEINKINILSIDGGGIKGIIPITIINYLLNNNIDILKKYNYYTWSSVAVLIICSLLLEKINFKDIEIIKNEYIKIMNKIFSNTYYNIGIYNILKEYFGDLTVGDLKKNIVIPLFDIVSNNIIIIDK